MLHTSCLFFALLPFLPLFLLLSGGPVSTICTLHLRLGYLGKWGVSFLKSKFRFNKSHNLKKVAQSSKLPCSP